MAFYGWMFWLLPLVFFMMFMRRRRWERWHARRPGDGRAERDAEQQRAYIDALETRVSQLEERLDFTERLLAGRSEAGAGR